MKKIYLTIIALLLPILTFAVDYSKQYFTIVPVDGDITISWIGYYINSTSSFELYWSKDNGRTWSGRNADWHSQDVKKGERIMFYANAHDQIGSIYSVTGRFIVEGNIMSLVYGKNFLNPNTEWFLVQDFSHNGGFLSNQANLISAENLVIPAVETDNYRIKLSNMFKGCTSLTKGPILQASTLTKGCCQEMFSGCTSLKYIKCLATDISATDCTLDWLKDVPPTGTFVKNASTAWPSGASGIPSGWTIETSTSTKRTINVETAGTLPDLISEEDKYMIEELTLTGELNGTDFKFIREMAGISVTFSGGHNDFDVYYYKTNGKLKSIDLSGTAIVSGGNPYDYFTVPSAENHIEYLENCVHVWLDGELLCRYIENNRITRSLFDWTILESIVLPNSVTSIEEMAFLHCNSLLSIVSEIKNPFKISENVFPSEVYSTATLTVPYGTKSLYEATDGWKKFQNIVEADDPTTQIDYSKQPYTIVPVDKDLIVWFLGDRGLHTTESIIVNWSYDGGKNWQSGVGDYYSVPVNLGQKVSIKISSNGGECSSAWGVKNKNSEDAVLGRFYVEGALSSLRPCDGYQGYYKGKTTLISAENLYIPEGTDCEEMFSGCTSLTKAPVLSDKVLGENQYKNMFKGCTSLNYIKCLATDISASGCTEGWVDGVSPTGTFVKKASTAWPSGASGIPSGWTVESYKPSPKRTIHVATAGTLPDLIGDDKYEIEELTLTGELNGTDIHYIRDMAGINMDKMETEFMPTVNSRTRTQGKLKLLDLSDANIVEGGRDYYRQTNDNNFTFNQLYTKANSISACMFAGCWKLEQLILPRSVSAITDPLCDIYSLSTYSMNIKVLKVAEGNSYYDSRDNCNAIIETKTNTMIAGCQTTKIPESVTSIGDNAFRNLNYLGSITIPNSVTIIGSYTFYKCSSLTSITIPNRVTTIGCYAFSSCSSLTSITIPNSVKTIDMGAFQYCSGLTSITIPNSVTSIGDRAFMDCSGLTSITIPNSVTSIGDGAFGCCSGLISVIIGNNITSIGNAFSNCNNLKEMTLSQTAYDNGIPESVTRFTTYSKNPMRVEVVSKGVVSATMKIYPIDEQGNTNENNCYTVTTSGQTPGQYIRWKLDDENYGIVSEKTEGTLTLNTQPAQAMSTTKARLIATVNEADDDQHFGFEWLRYDAPESMPPYKVAAPLYERCIVGSLSGLNPDKYYKYRPYYQSDFGDMIYGEWITFNTGDANVFFEPEVHTKEATVVTNGGAQLSAVFVEGTDDIQEKGFEYWPKSSGARAVNSTRGTNVSTVIVSGNNTSVTLKGLKSGVEYGYRSYIKTASKTYYGEEKSFKTVVSCDVNGDGSIDDKDLNLIVRCVMDDVPEGFDKTQADINGDGKVDAADVVKIVNMIK